MRTSKKNNKTIKQNRTTRSKKTGGNTPQSKKRRTESRSENESKQKRRRGNPLRTLILNVRSEANQREQIKNFVHNNVKDGIYIIDFPVPPERHAILVDVQHDNKKVMVSDWGGDIRKRNLKLPKRWEIYKLLLDELENIYKVEYFEVDEPLRDLASIEHKSRATKNCEGGQGGCSFYIYKWEAKHCHNGECSAKRQRASSSDHDSTWENPL